MERIFYTIEACSTGGFLVIVHDRESGQSDLHEWCATSEEARVALDVAEYVAFLSSEA